MKVVEHLEQKKTNPIFSYEIVPPPRGKSAQEVIDIVKKLAPMDPPWIDVTAHTANAYYKKKRWKHRKKSLQKETWHHWNLWNYSK